MFFHSLKKEILFFALGLTIITIVVATAINISSIQTSGDAAAKSTSNVLQDQAESFLVQITQGVAEQQDLVFEQMRSTTDNTAAYVSSIYENPSIFGANSYWKFNERIFEKDGRYLNDVSDISTIHIPSFVALTQGEKKNIELTANLDFVVPNILERNPDIAAMYTIDTAGVSRYFPNIILGSIAPPDYDPREDVYYKPVIPENNPDKHILWSPLYEDAAGRGLMITVTAPVYTEKGFTGMVGMDVFLAQIIESISAYSPIENSYAFLIDNQGSAIAFPDQAYEDILGRPKQIGEERLNLVHSTTISPQFSSILEEMVGGNTGFQIFDTEDNRLYIAYAPLKQTGFSMAVITEEATILKAVGALRTEIHDSIGRMIAYRILPASLFIVFFASMIGFLLISRIVKPIHQLTEGARAIGSGNLDYHLEIESKNEIGELASSFNQMNRDLKASREKINEYSRGLEVIVKKRTRALKEANDELRVLDRAKSEFISLASHQLRAPLTVVKGYISMMREGSFGALNTKIGEVLGRVYMSNEQIIKLVASLLDLSRIESGKIQYDFVKGDFVKIVENVIEEFRPSAEKKKISLGFTNAAGTLASFPFDSDKIREVVINLIDNAIKYSDGGRIDTQLEQGEMGNAVSVRLSVHDNGLGIKKEDIAKLFVKFKRTDEAQKKDPNGMGIGLYFVKRVMEDHGGRVGVSSEGLGKGATFFIELPIARGN